MERSKRIQVSTPILASILIFLLLVAGCTSITANTVKSSGTTQSMATSGNTVERVEVIHFHGDQQCTSCIAVGDLAQDTVNEYFPHELASGKLSFQHINYDDPANKDIAGSYGVIGSSLWITTHDASGVHRQQDLDVWSLTGDKKAYMDHLSGIIAKRLNGEIS